MFIRNISLIFLLFSISFGLFASCKSEEDSEVKTTSTASEEGGTSDNGTTTDNSSSSNSTVCPKYDRSEYSHWIDADGDCQDTRVEVLIAENLGTITYSTSNSCKIITGSWYDPFSDSTLTTASRLDVDHMVPLKEAHESGGYLWTSTKKKEYANDLSSPETLIAVSGSINRSKGSRDPAEWLPPNTNYQKTYASNWASIKVKWGLTADENEINALKSLLGSSAVLPVQADEAFCIGSIDESITDNASCCKWCNAGKACGDTCISKSYTCSKPKGCACDKNLPEQTQSSYISPKWGTSKWNVNLWDNKSAGNNSVWGTSKWKSNQ